jgi:hypothetical protein
MQTKSNILIAIAVIAVGIISFIGIQVVLGQKPEKGAAGNLATVQLPSNGEMNSVGEGSRVSEADNKSVDDKKADLSGKSGAFIASKNGKKYFPVGCGAAKTIKKENAIFFNTPEEAEASGRTQSVQCKY